MQAREIFLHFHNQILWIVWTAATKPFCRI